jgi:hypothetical protein
MEIIKGTVANLQHDLWVRPYGDPDSDRLGTKDITNFELAGKSMQYRLKPTFNSISEGDELVVAGKQKGTRFQVYNFRNLTKNIASYEGESLATARGAAALMFLSALATAAYFFYTGAALFLPLTILILFVGITVAIVYADFSQRKAIKSMESYK